MSKCFMAIDHCKYKPAKTALSLQNLYIYSSITICQLHLQSDMIMKPIMKKVFGTNGINKIQSVCGAKQFYLKERVI